MTSPNLRAFISFASEDMGSRNFLVRQSRWSKTPWTFEDGSLRVPFDDAVWKKRTRPLIERSDVLILLIGKDTYRAPGAIWEVECARELSLPIFGIQIDRNNPGRIPNCMRGISVVYWDFDSIQSELDRAQDWTNRDWQTR
jgi:hypothetical protein